MFTPQGVSANRQRRTDCGESNGKVSKECTALGIKKNRGSQKEVCGRYSEMGLRYCLFVWI